MKRGVMKRAYIYTEQLMCTLLSDGCCSRCWDLRNPSYVRYATTCQIAACVYCACVRRKRECLLIAGIPDIGIKDRVDSNRCSEWIHLRDYVLHIALLS